MYIFLPRNTEKQSALWNLLQYGFFKSATYLLRSGWNLTKEAWLENFDVSAIDLEQFTCKSFVYKRLNADSEMSEFKIFLEGFNQGPKKLGILCRDSIRKCLTECSGGQTIFTCIQQLPVPLLLKSIISLADFAPEFEEIHLDTLSRSVQN